MQKPDFDPLERVPIYRLVHNAILEKILAGGLRAGDLLPGEIQLAVQLGVNRSTVREGIRLLEQSGLVEKRGSGKRVRITLPHYLELASSASRALILHSVTFRELWEAAMMLEPTIAEIAARSFGPEPQAALADNIAEMEALIMRLESDEAPNVDLFVALDRGFHQIIADATGNRVLALTHEPVTSLFIPAGRIILPRLKTYRRVLEAHRFIFDALVSRDESQALAWMQRHMDDFRRAYDLTGLSLDAPLNAALLGVIPLR